MTDDLILSVRRRIAETFSQPGSPTPILSPLTSPRHVKFEYQERTQKKFSKISKPKEYLSLPNISVHRNPMSLLSERDAGRRRQFSTKKNLWKGVYASNLISSTSGSEIDWDKIITTCGDLIKNKC